MDLQHIWNGIAGGLGLFIDGLGTVFSDIRPFIPMAIAGTIVWSIWFVRFVMSHSAKPIVTDFRTTTSIVVPSYHEDPAILLDCLETWRAQDPTEIIVVLDVADLEAYDRITELGDARIQPLLYEHVGKRSALGVGIRRATGEVLVLVDSDTRWTPGLLEAVQMPFDDPEVGGVSTQQNVFQRETSVWRRIADWMVNLRYADYVPAQGKAGAVACLSGRTAAYRRAAVLPVLDRLENEFFLGTRCIAGDDGRLTWLVLASGYKTVHQSSAKALSMFPATFRAFVKQRVRWSRNSFRCYLTAIFKGWLFRQPIITQLTVLQILLTPVTMGMSLTYLFFSRLDLTPIGIAITLGWVLLGRGIRGISHLRRHPRDLLLLPLMTLTVILVALPIKAWAFVTMNKQGWLTRKAGQIGGDGQDSASLETGVDAASAAATPGTGHAGAGAGPDADAPAREPEAVHA
ncbi:glycosyltransferase [Schumannella sp. 10F1B-5-1]|uniref:glycosyltransferase n=1 Tax=Schumannella sp. 10F1B-5-1 TaxID=2590780 RepID=UPI0011313DE2|nr:glycosyltransferase [Schumannella sp. 10F1B-5-1]TPW76701.1 glycosyltransferase [Schumannella sp. 10F1B-5-1]